MAVIDWDADRVTLLATWQDDEVLDAGTTIPLDDFYLPETLRKGEVAYAPHFADRSLPRAAEKLQAAGIRSVLALPMVYEDDLVGVLHFGRRQPEAFTEDDRDIGEELSDHLAVALRQSQLFEKVQRQRERLEERVEERTEELRSFTYSVSHDLRAPLRAVDGYARILREQHAERLDEEGQRLLNVVCESAQTMQDLIDDLLTLSRVGRHEMNPVRIDMNALAREVFDELRRSHPAAEEATLDVHSLPDAVADRSMVGRLLTNLLSNAVKYSREEPTPHIEVGGERRDDEALFYVRDNGVGFSMKRADKLFGVFERLHDEDAFEGTGVGLAIVKRIVRRHDGEVWAEGTEGEGASFFFTLPSPNGAEG